MSSSSQSSPPQQTSLLFFFFFFLALTKQHMQTHLPAGKYTLLALALSDLFVSVEKVSAQHNAQGKKTRSS